jgi:hypothetical protein
MSGKQHRPPEVIRMYGRTERNVNVTELHKMIGQTGAMSLRDGCDVDVQIVDVKVSYGSVRYQVEPVAGSGSCWISADTLHAHTEIESATLDELKARLSR